MRFKANEKGGGKKTKQGVITLNSVLTIEHKNVTQPNSTTLNKGGHT
jgi:hypothetical protein